ncbi:uncharacterized protein LOC141649390 [Silene latifolia]|uniref:uncharacterized protein LOC141649390 n=1 Tax=Silene latifolia TaxID=37657 RepID=UPI003D7745DC
MEIIYHEGKENVVANVLSRKSVHNLCMAMSQVKLRDEVENMGISMIRKWDIVSDLKIELELYAEIRDKHKLDSRVAEWRKQAEVGGTTRFTNNEDGSLRFNGRWCVADNEELKQSILTEAQNTPYSVHPGGDKFYKDLKKTLWWLGIKKVVAEFVARCLNCVRLKGVHKRPQGKVKSLNVPK